MLEKFTSSDCKAFQSRNWVNVGYAVSVSSLTYITAKYDLLCYFEQINDKILFNGDRLKNARDC